MIFHKAFQVNACSRGRLAGFGNILGKLQNVVLPGQKNTSRVEKTLGTETDNPAFQISKSNTKRAKCSFLAGQKKTLTGQKRTLGL